MELRAQEARGLRHPDPQVRGGGAPGFNRGWHLPWTKRNMLLVSLCVAKRRGTHREPRRGHTRDDYPVMDSDWRHVLLVLTADGENDVHLRREEQHCDAARACWTCSSSKNEEVYTGEELGGHRADSAGKGGSA